MARNKSLPYGIAVQEIIHGDPGNSLPVWVREIARDPKYGYGDSAVPWNMWVHPADVDEAFKARAQGNGASCVLAAAGRRLGAQAVYFYRHYAWVDFGAGPVVRFHIPNATYRNVIDPFDNNDRDNVLPGMYPLLPPLRGRSLKHLKEYNRTRQYTKSQGIDPKRQRQHSERVILAPEAKS